MSLNKRLQECAEALNEGKLLAKLSGRDAIAQELKYSTTVCVSVPSTRGKGPS